MVEKEQPRSRSRRRENGVPSRWEQYRELLACKGVPQKAQRWYVARVEAFLKEMRPESLRELTPEDITGYISNRFRAAAGSTISSLGNWWTRSSS